MENSHNAVQKSLMRAAFEAYFVNPVERDDIPEFWEDWQAAWNAALASMPTDERAAFEQWYAAQPCAEPLDRHQERPDEYLYLMPHQAWQAWQARAQIAAQAQTECKHSRQYVNRHGVSSCLDCPAVIGPISRGETLCNSRS